MSQKKPDLMTTKQVAELLGVSKSRVDQFARKRRLPSTFYGTVRLFRRADVLAFKKIDRPKGKPPKRATP